MRIDTLLFVFNRPTHTIEVVNSLIKQTKIPESLYVYFDKAITQEDIEKQRINIHGSMPDYLFPTTDGFVDILEIKLPKFEVIKEGNHKGSWIWSPEANSAIGQVANYLSEIDKWAPAIEKEIQLPLLKPRAFILIGRSDDWNSDKQQGLRNLNHHLHGIRVLTYTELVKRGERIIMHPENWTSS